jgi:hypothetical protein
MHPEVAHCRFEHLAIDPGEDGVAAPHRSGRQVSRPHAATRSDGASNVSRAALVSLRIWNACTIWITPRITNDTPETRVSTRMESNGQTSMMAPAIMDMTSSTTYQPRPGTSRSLIATAVSETPRKMKPVPIHSDSSKTAQASPKWRKDKIAKTSDSAPVKNSRTHVAADRGKVNAKNRLDSTGRRNASICGGVGMGVLERRRAVQLYRGQIPSPGRPTVAWRQDRVRFWAAIAAGAMTEDAAAEAGVSSPVGFRWFRHAGGVNPQLPETVSGRYPSSGEREDIALWRAQGCGVREISRRLGRAPSTISRELRRNAATRTYRLEYKASIAQWHAERRARRPKTAKLVSNDRLRRYVQDKLSGVVRGPDGQIVAGPAVTPWKGRNKAHRGDRAWVTAWSPEQIAQRIKFDLPDDKSMRISHEAIYQALYVESRGALKRELVSCLRRGRALRVPRARARQKAWALSPRKR